MKPYKYVISALLLVAAIIYFTIKYVTTDPILQIFIIMPLGGLVEYFVVRRIIDYQKHERD